jgi:5S rRNA maturation endonuclease (ribonuclease M5)
MAPTGELFMQHFEKVIQNRIKYKLLDDNTQRQRMIILDDIDYYGEGIPDYLRQAKDIELGILTKVTNKKDRTPKLYVVAMPKGSWKDIDSTKSKVLRGLDEFGN